jgi:protein TonB
MLAAPHKVWIAPRLEHGKTTSAGTLALAGSVAVHAAFLLAPAASPRAPEPAVPAMSVVQVRIVAPVPAATLAPESAASPAKVAAVVTPRSAVAKPHEPRDTLIEQALPTRPAESTLVVAATASRESAGAPEHALSNPLPTREEKLAATPASMAVAFLNAPQPDYPASAREEGQEGLVVLRVRVSKEGRPVEIFVGRSSGIRALDAAALAGVKRWTFRPARVADQDVEAWMDVPIRFRLQ